LFAKLEVAISFVFMIVPHSKEKYCMKSQLFYTLMILKHEDFRFTDKLPPM